LLDGSETAAMEFGGQSVCACQVRIHDCRQAHRFALLAELLIDAGVIAPEGARPDYRRVNEFPSMQIDTRATGCRIKI